MKSLFLLCILVFLTSCASRAFISTSEAQQGINLDRAEEVSVDKFFELRMQSELESRPENDWQILNEDAQFVYFGLPKITKTSVNYQLIEPFYKVNRNNLIKKFPGYGNTEGKHVKGKVFHYFIKPLIEERLNKECPNSYELEYSKKEYELTFEGIRVDIELDARCYEKKNFSAKIGALINAQTLDILEENINIKD